jgi:cytoskeletal protein CcmA (bactofilin family)
MTAASPPPKPASPVAPPAAAPAAPAAAPKPAAAAPSPPPKVPRSGEVQDRGVSRRDAVHALRWSTRGSVKVLGEVDVGQAKLAGTTAVGGAVSSDALRSTGTLDVGGTLEVVGALFSDGILRTRGPVHAGEAELRGTTHLLGDLRVDRGLTVHGSLIAPSVRAEGLIAEGELDVPGEISASHVDVRFRARSRVGGVVGATVRLTVRPPNPIEMVLGRELPVEVLRVEADSVELEGVDVRFVRAPEIVLGRDAHVTEFEGKIVRRHPSARVGPESRSPPPHGLSR